MTSYVSFASFYILCHKLVWPALDDIFLNIWKIELAVFQIRVLEVAGSLEVFQGHFCEFKML